MIAAIEGLDAAGKATQSRMLVDYLKSTGRDAALMSFPRYETTLGKAMKRHLRQEIALIDFDCMSPLGEMPVASEDALAFQAFMLWDKVDAVPEIGAHIKAGRVVVCDRWMPSAYAFGVADGLDPSLLLRAMDVLPKADISIFIDLPPEEAQRRRPELRDRYEKDRAKQAVIAKNYGDLWLKKMNDEPGDWAIVHGLGTVDEVAERIRRVVDVRMDWREQGL